MTTRDAVAVALRVAGLGVLIKMAALVPAVLELLSSNAYPGRFGTLWMSGVVSLGLAGLLLLCAGGPVARLLVWRDEPLALPALPPDWPGAVVQAGIRLTGLILFAIGAPQVLDAIAYELRDGLWLDRLLQQVSYGLLMAGIGLVLLLARPHKREVLP